MHLGYIILSPGMKQCCMNKKPCGKALPAGQQRKILICIIAEKERGCNEQKRVHSLCGFTHCLLAEWGRNSYGFEVDRNFYERAVKEMIEPATRAPEFEQMEVLEGME